MRRISWSKEEKTALCLYCKKNRIPLEDWNKRCEECRAKLKDDEAKELANSGAGSNRPAAIIETDKGEKIFVDKFGNEVPNPGYDLKNDPRGNNIAGKGPTNRTMI